MRAVLNVNTSRWNDSPAPSGLPTMIEGHPVAYRRKTLLHAGKAYIGPNGEKLGPFTQAELDAFIAKHHQLRDEQSYRPYVPTSHAKPSDAKDNRGFIVGLAREGDNLIGVHQLIGEDALKDASRNGSSVAIEFDWKDHEGKSWGPVIVHNALTPNPHITDLGPFVQLSKDSAGGVAAESVPVLKEVNAMDWNKKIREILGLSDESIVDEALIEQLKTKLTADTSKITQLSKDVTDRTAERDDAKNQLTLASGKIAAFSKDTIDPHILGMMVTLAGQTIDARIGTGDGKISPDQAAKLKASLRVGGKPNVLMFSKDADDKPIWEHMIDIATAKPAPPAGELTGVQDRTIEMSRDIPGGDPVEKPLTDAKKNELLSLTSLGRVSMAN